MAAIAGGTLDGVRTILICDDERHIVRLIQVNLERNGYEVEAVFDSQSCLETLESGDYDLLILDGFINGGKSTAQIIQACEGRTKIVHLEAETERDHPGGGGHGPGPTAGANLVLKKPFSPIQLLSLIRDLGRG